MMQTERDRLMQAALTHVPFDGMNDRALLAGARDLNLPVQTVRLLFPQGGAGLAAAYHRKNDTALRESLQDNPPQGRFRDKVAEAVWRRIQLSDRDLVRAGASVLALPQNSALGGKLMWETADAIWDGLGDSSQDVNWYSKRATLAAVLGATVLFWIGDDSPDAGETRDFIDRRIDNVMQVEKLKAQLRKIPGVATMTSLTTDWIEAPQDRDLPGNMKEKI